MNILSQIKKISLKNMVLPVIICITVVASILLLPFEAILNPVVIQNIWLEQDKLNSTDYVEVTLEEIHYTGYDVTTLANRKYSYYYSLKDQQCFLFLIPGSDTPQTVIKDYTFKGAIINKKNCTSYTNLLENLSSDIQWNTTSLNQAISPYIISNADYHPLMFIIIMAILFFILAYELCQLIKHVIRYINPYAYPICPHATITNKKAFVSDIHKQLQNNLISHQDDLYLTKKFLIEYNSRKLVVVPLSTAIWGYRMGTLNYRLAHRTPKYNLYIVLLSGDTIVFENKGSEATSSILDELRNTNNNLILGYTDSKRKVAKQLIKEYNKSKKSKKRTQQKEDKTK